MSEQQPEQVVDTDDEQVTVYTGEPEDVPHSVAGVQDDLVEDDGS